MKFKKIIKYKNEIEEMITSGHSSREIQGHLKSKGVTVSHVNIAEYIKANHPSINYKSSYFHSIPFDESFLEDVSFNEVLKDFDDDLDNENWERRNLEILNDAIIQCEKNIVSGDASVSARDLIKLMKLEYKLRSKS